MKNKQTNKQTKYFYLTNVFLTLFIFLFFNCEHNDEISKENKLKISTISFENFSNKIDFEDFKIKLSKKKSISSLKKSESDFEIDYSTIKFIEINENLNSYTLKITREEKTVGYFENLVLMEENSKIKSAYIIKYFPTKLDFNNQHNSYNFEGFREIENLNIGELDLNAKLTCGSGWEVWCSWEENHIAQGSCFQNGHLYLKEVTICYNSPYDQTIEEYPINGGDTGGNITNINSSTPVTSAVIENADGTIISVNEIITNNINSLLNFQLNKAQLEWLRNNLNQAITLNSILFNNPTNDEKAILINAINNLMSFNIDNYPGMNEGLPFEWWKNNSFIENNSFFELIPFEFNFVPVEKPNEKEVALFALFPKQAIIHILNAKTAINVSQQLASNGIFGQSAIKALNNGKGDAFRHAFWNALGTSSILKFVMKLFADAHEWNKTGLDVDMDYFNNHIGREVGEDYFLTFPSNDFLQQLILTNLSNGNLRFISPTDSNGGILSNSILIPTN